MKRRTWLVGGVGVLALVGAAVMWRGPSNERAAAQAPGQVRTVSVEVAPAARRKVPVRIEALGNVAPIASVALKTRVDSEIVSIHFADGATVKKGDVLVRLDSRQIEAEIKRVEAVIAGAEAQLEQATRDVERYSELVSRNASTLVTLNNAKTQVNISRASAESNKATLENLKVQLSYTTIRALIVGRISAAAVKVGNYVRSADATPIATIIQTAPIYVTFTVPQRSLPDIRHAIAAESAVIEVTVPGDDRRARGAVTMIENTVDAATGMVVVRATMPNADELLWPGTLTTVQLTLREEDSVVVPAAAVQVSQTGTFVFVVKDGVAKVQPVTVARAFGSDSVISSGLAGDETVVTDGHLLLVDGSRITARERRPGA
jgi:multidrug efflux system membrane fusion protein